MNEIEKFMNKIDQAIKDNIIKYKDSVANVLPDTEKRYLNILMGCKRFFCTYIIPDWIETSTQQGASDAFSHKFDGYTIFLPLPGQSNMTLARPDINKANNQVKAIARLKWMVTKPVTGYDKIFEYEYPVIINFKMYDEPDQDFKVCPCCKGELSEKVGKYGPFLGCNNFPGCKFTMKVK